MALKVRNWEEFQHFKDRTPPWIKLYRYLLDDPEWHELSGDDSKVLVMLWLIASEDKDMEGNLPSKKKLCFRLRITEIQLNQSLTNLNNWLIDDDIEVISECYQDDAPETEERQRQRRGDNKENSKPKQKITLTNDGKFENLDSHLELWNSSYPNVDVEAEIRRAGAWCKSNPRKAPKSDFPRFLNAWLSRSNENNKSNNDDVFAGAI